MSEAIVVKSLEDLYKLIGKKEFECFLRLKNGKYKKFTKILIDQVQSVTGLYEVKVNLLKE